MKNDLGPGPLAWTLTWGLWAWALGFQAWPWAEAQGLGPDSRVQDWAQAPRNNLKPLTCLSQGLGPQAQARGPGLGRRAWGQS